MKIKLSIYPETGQTYIPKALRENGFEGEVEGYAVGEVIVLVSPKASPKQIKSALKFIADEIESHAIVEV